MIETKVIKSTARGKISGFAGSAMLGTLIMMLIMGAAGSLYGLALLVVGPMNVGYVLFCQKIMDEKVADYNQLFAGFNDFVNNLVAGLVYTLIVAIGFILLIVPGIWLACGLSLTFMIMAENKGMSGIDALRMSWAMMQGNKWKYFCLNLRFIGWALLSILTLGILTLWIQPWMQMSFIEFYRQVSDEYCKEDK